LDEGSVHCKVSTNTAQNNTGDAHTSLPRMGFELEIAVSERLRPRGHTELFLF